MPRRPRLLGITVVVVCAGSCTPVGLPVGPGPIRVASDPEPTPAVARAPVVRGGNPVSLPRNGEREFVDVILDSPAAADTAFQRQVAFWVEFWAGEQAEWFGLYLERMGQHGPMVEREVARRGLPQSLRYLPIVESGYSPRIVSRAGATGLWQLMGPTAGDFGLRVNSIVDDRRDPVASTHAALEYLEQLEEQFDSWFLALAAYNMGQGAIRQVLREAGREGGDESFLAIRSILPAETREFVPRLFAAAEIAIHPTRYGFDPIEWDPVVFDEVVVPDATSLDVVARSAGVEEAEVLELNQQFLRGFTPPGERRVVRVPVGSGGKFEQAFALVPESERLSFVEHFVTNGETFSHIAVRYDVSLSDLMAMNGNIDPLRLQIGTRVVVPVGGSSAARAQSTVTRVTTRTPGEELFHTVAAGESLWTIARRYGVTTAALVRENERGSSTVIRPGERLRIP